MTIDPELLTGLGAALAIFLSSTGAAIASAHSGIFAVRSNDYKDFLPIVISGVLAIYGIIVGVILCGKFKGEISAVDGYRNVSAGLSVGLACWASGLGMSKFIQQCNEGKAVASPPRTGASAEREPLLANGQVAESRPNFVKLAMVLVYLEAIGLYGLIVALLLVN